MREQSTFRSLGITWCNGKTMPIHSPSLVELHAFLAVARTGGFRRASEELCLTQAAVSRAVQRLEETLGQDMFVRATGGVLLTSAGRQLRKLTEHHVAGLEAAALILRHKPERLQLRISVVTSLGSLWLMPRLEGFRQMHPEVEIEFRQYDHAEDFARDDVDLWLDLKRRSEYRWPRKIAAQLLLAGDLVAVCAPRLAKQAASAQQLLTLPLLYHSNYRENWSLWARALEATMPARWKGSGFDLVTNMLDAARAGMGVAIVPECMAQRDIQAGRLVVPIPGTAPTGRGYYLCRPRAQSAHPAADVFSAWVRQQALG